MEDIYELLRPYRQFTQDWVKLQYPEAFESQINRTTRFNKRWNREFSSLQGKRFFARFKLCWVPFERKAILVWALSSGKFFRIRFQMQLPCQVRELNFPKFEWPFSDFFQRDACSHVASLFYAVVLVVHHWGDLVIPKWFKPYGLDGYEPHQLAHIGIETKWPRRCTACLMS